MFPTLLDTSIAGRHVVLPAYTACILLGGIAAFVIGTMTATRRGLPLRPVVACLLLGVFAVFVGARLLHRIACPSFYTGHPALVFTLSRIGLSVYGGLILAMVVVPVVCRAHGMNLWRLADSITPAMCIGIAIARTGCFLNGCCCGTPTKLPWRVVYPMGSPAYMHQMSKGLIGIFDSSLPVHPTQLYEVAVLLLCVLLAVWLMRRKARDGTAFLSFVLVFTAVRWADFHLLAQRDTPDPAHWLYPSLYALVILSCSGAMVSLLRKR